MYVERRNPRSVSGRFYLFRFVHDRILPLPAAGLAPALMRVPALGYRFVPLSLLTHAPLRHRPVVVNYGGFDPDDRA